MSLAQVGSADSIAALAALKDRVTQRVLMCGNALTFGMHAVCFAPGADRAAAWKGVAEALYRMRRAEKLAGHMDLVVIKDLAEEACAESAVLGKLSYGKVATQPDMVLAIDPAWRSHADYLASFTSKYRSDVKSRVMKRFDESGCTLEAMDAAAATAEARSLQDLYLQVHGGASLRPFTLRPEYRAQGAARMQAAAAVRLGAASPSGAEPDVAAAAGIHPGGRSPRRGSLQEGRRLSR